VGTSGYAPLDLFRLDGRTAVVTGASSGLGVGFARALASVGANLVLAARRREMLEEVAAELRGSGAKVIACRADVTSEQDCRAIADEAMDRFGRIDVLVNNAGVGSAVPALREDPADFRNVVDINLTGTFLMAQACAAHMQPGSSIVNVASVLGVVASRYPGAAYAASKSGVIGLTRDLAMQWTGRRGIRVNALAPGFFASEMTAVGADALERMVADNSLLARFGEQDELDGALLYLASPASSYTTGTTLVVDGGLSTTL
jgi:NAD(P)-dependent dehydrogenase (short-subunit alcohol dehydrogenase family)